VSYRDLALKSLDHLPPFSPVLNLLMASMANEDVSFAQLGAVIERDTVLTGNVLRLVNSALYGRRGTVSSVRAAVSILGINKLRNYVLGLSVSRMWSKVRTPAVWSMARFNDHSVATAVLADMLVQKTAVEYPEGAFAAGLLHDLGRMVIANSLPDEFERILKLQAESGKPLEVCEHEILECTHSELSAAVLTRWNLPAPIQKAVLYHHRADLDPVGGTLLALPLSKAVEVANQVVNGAGHAIAEFDQKTSRPADEALARLGLADQAETLVASFEVELKAVSSTL
jgi:HD-like signal output (HDOD) protein